MFRFTKNLLENFFAFAYRAPVAAVAVAFFILVAFTFNLVIALDKNEFRVIAIYVGIFVIITLSGVLVLYIVAKQKNNDSSSKS
jgi:hypothetical protein